MTGSLCWGKIPIAEPPQYSARFIHLGDGQNVYFRDPRKFRRDETGGKDTKEMMPNWAGTAGRKFYMQYFSEDWQNATRQ